MEGQQAKQTLSGQVHKSGTVWTSTDLGSAKWLVMPGAGTILCCSVIFKSSRHCRNSRGPCSLRRSPPCSTASRPTLRARRCAAFPDIDS